MTVIKTPGVQFSDHITCVRLQEIILGYKAQCPVGKVLIDAEKITFYKFGLKLGLARHSVNGIIYNNGYLSYSGLVTPVIEDTMLCNQLFDLFNLSRI